MKRLLSTILILCAIILISACGKSGKEMEVSLKGNITTGYEWSYQISNPSILKVTRDEYIPDEHEEGMVGYGGVHYFTFAGLKEGATDVILRYARSFEDAKPIYMITYQVEADASNNLKVVSKTGNYSDETLPEPTIK